jgi:uracil phosphoribosyltransferase
MKGVIVVDHPLVQHKLTLIRQKDRSTKSFRELCRELGILLCYEITRDLPLDWVEIETPLTKMKAPVIAGKKLVLAPILRAGLALIDGMLDLVPAARVAHIGLYRDADTNTMVAAIDRLKERGATSIRAACLIAAPEGVERLIGIHPDVKLWTCAIDERLDEDAFIIPGLGDAGDRAYGTQ